MVMLRATRKLRVSLPLTAAAARSPTPCHVSKSSERVVYPDRKAPSFWRRNGLGGPGVESDYGLADSD